MAQATAPSLQMIFSSSQNKTSGQESRSLSLYLEENRWGPLIELVKEYGSFELYKKNADAFLLKIGDYVIDVTQDFQKTIVSFPNISSLHPGAAELLAKVADLLFYDRKRRFMIAAFHLPDELMVLEACYKLGIEVKPADKGQSERFAAFEAKTTLKKNVGTVGLARAMLSQDQNGPPTEPGHAKQ